MPRAQQIDAHHGEQQQGHQSETEGADLQTRRERPATEVGEAVAPAISALRDLLDRAQQKPRRQQRDDQQSGDTGEHDGAGLGVAGLPENQTGDDHHAEHVSEQPRRIRRAQVTSQDAQRRHVGQRDQRRQRESKQQHHADRECGDDRRPSRPRKLRLEQRLQQPCEHLLTAKRDDAAGDAGRDSEPQELQRVEREHPALRRAKAAHHTGRVELSMQITARRERDGDRGEKHRDERRKTEEFLRAFERRAHFGTQVANGFQTLSRGELRHQPRAIFVSARSGQQQAITGAIARLEQIGRRQVLHRHQQFRRQREEAAGDLGLLLHHRTDGEISITELHLRADAETQSRSEPLVDPDRSGLRKVVRHPTECVVRVFENDLAAQRVAGLGRFHFGKHRTCSHRIGLHGRRVRASIGLNHAVEADAFDHFQAATTGFFGVARRQRAIGGKQQVGAEQNVGLRAECAFDAVREEADGADAGDGEEESGSEYAELARAAVPDALAPRERDDFQHLCAAWRRPREMIFSMVTRLCSGVEPRSAGGDVDHRRRRLIVR